MDPITLSAIIGATASAIPFVAGLFKKKRPADIWHVWTWEERKQYVKESLLLATTAVLSGEAMILDDVMKPLIGKVDKEPYADWLRRNRYHITPMMNEAEAELAQAKKMAQSGMSFKNTFFKYISPDMIDALNKRNTGLASVFHGVSLTTILLLSSAGLLIKKVLKLKVS